MRKRVLIVRDSDEYLNLGVFLPEDMGALVAQELVWDAIRAAKDAAPDEWDYGDVIKVLATSAPTLEVVEILEMDE
jgi:hypothetical protein